MEGLVFSVQHEDQLKLDRYEGVLKGYYGRRFLPVQLVENLDGPWRVYHLARKLESGKAPKKTRQISIDASVYVSLAYVRWEHRSRTCRSKEPLTERRARSWNVSNISGSTYCLL